MTNRGVIAVAGLVLFVGGCSGLGSSDGSTEGTDADRVASPLSEFLGLGDFTDLDSADTQARIVEMQRANNEAIVACMAAEGFEYIAPNLDETSMFAAETADGVTYGTPEYTARYGFGVTTQYWSQSTVGPELVGYDDSEDLVEEVDPNQAYVESLSEADRAAYDAALYGESIDYEWDLSLTNEENQTRADAFYADFEPSGCFFEAQADDGFARAAEFYDQFGSELEALYTSIEADPRIADALGAIEDCVVGKGLVSVDPTDPYGYWDQALADIAENHATETSDSDGTGIPTVVIDDEGLAKLAKLQAEEIAIAIATDECGGSQDDLSSLFQSVTAEYEQRFLDDNADRVAAFAEGDS